MLDRREFAIGGGHRPPPIGSLLRARNATALRVRLGTEIVVYVDRLHGIRVSRVVTHVTSGAGRTGLATRSGDWVRKECNHSTRLSWRRRVHRPNQVRRMELIMTGNLVLADF